MSFCNEYSIKNSDHRVVMPSCDYKIEGLLHHKKKAPLRNAPVVVVDEYDEDEILIEYDNVMVKNNASVKSFYGQDLLTKVGCTALLLYIALKEKAGRCYRWVKNILSNFLDAIKI